MRCLLLVCLLLNCSIISFAQVRNHEVVASDGGSAKVGDISLDWTLGEIAIESGTAYNRLFTEGFHQPLLLIQKVETDGQTITGTDQKLTIDVRPNPVFARFSIDFPKGLDNDVTLVILDGNGQLVLKKILNAGFLSYKIDMSHRPAGRYILKVFGEDGKSSEAYQIIKVD